MEPVIRARTSHLEVPKLAPLMLAVLLLGAQGGAQALGVGRPLTLSALGQPLNLLFPIQLAGDEALTPDCARAEVIAGETRIPVGLVQVQLEGESDSTVRAIRVQSLVPVDEPLVTVSLSIGCPTRYTRQFTAFVDPPSLRTDLPQEARLPDTTVRNYSPQLRAALATAEAKPAQLLAPTAPPATAPQLAQLPAEAASVPAPRPAAPRRPARSSEAVVAAPGNDEPASAPARAASAPKVAAKPPRKPAASTVASAGPATGVKAAVAARPRLQLEAAEVLETAVPASAPLPVASAPDAGAERIKRLEESLQRMQAQNRDTSDKLALLRSQLEQEHSARFQNPVVYVLALLLAGLGAFCVYLWRARARDRALHESTWWNEVKAQSPRGSRAAREPQAMGMAGASMPAPLDEDLPLQPARAGAPAAADAAGLVARVSASLDQTDLLRAAETPDEDNGGQSTLAIPQLGDFVSDSMLMPPSSLRRPAYSEPLSVSLVEPTMPLDLRAGGARAPGKPLSVESLIDLEQQAEFFMLLGQEGAAIELLSGKLSGAASPWPYLMLLEIYQRQEDRSAYELVGESYGHQFSVPAPAWDLPLGDGPGLAACPEVMHTLEKIWIDNAASMDLLRGLLSRGGQWQGGRVALPPEELQDLALMRDMLMLYLVARDLAEHPARTAAEAVDLILPLDGASADDGLDLDLSGDSSVAR